MGGARLGAAMRRVTVIFEHPFKVEPREEAVPDPAEGEVLVEAAASAISAGSEMLVYKGLFPSDLPVDESIPSLSAPFKYPLKYGYGAVGRVIASGAGVGKEALGSRVFSFHPHESGFLARPEGLIRIPSDIQWEDALFLPNMETAVNLVMDGRPLVGERVAVFGQGIVGLLTAALLQAFPLEALATLDRHGLRREASLAAGADAAIDPDEDHWEEALLESFSGRPPDLIYELSGNPEALNGAIRIAGFNSRVVVGSWYGVKASRLDLGGSFHRNRVTLTSSQVSSISPEFSGSWNKARRIGVAWEMIRRVRPRRFITHRFPVEEAKTAYALIAERPQETIQTIFTYRGRTNHDRVAG